MEALTLRGISKRFGGLTAVREVHMDLAPGERRALIGPNGAGKTTLFNVIAGDMFASSGTITIFGKDVTHMPVNKRISLGLRRTYQSSSLLNMLTVRENLYLGIVGPDKGHLNMIKPALQDKSRMERVEEVAVSVGLADKLNMAAGDLSHGECRQLELGLAIAWQPKLVMLDEPAAGLSPEERTKIKKLLLDLPRDITLLLIEHDMDIALSVVENVTVLHEGSIVAEGVPSEITANPLVQRIYLGGTLHE